MKQLQIPTTVEWHTYRMVAKGIWMTWFLVMQVISTLIELIQLGRNSEREKDLEMLLLRRQLAIYQRQKSRSLQLTRSEKVTLVVLATKLKARSRRTLQAISEVIRIVKPATLLSGINSW